jgi:hypothetical protein
MAQEHPITPPPELVQQWWDGTHGALYEFEAVTTQAARWGADEQLEQDARWLDTCALFSTHLTITPSGDALRQAMRPKPPSLKERALAALNVIEDKMLGPTTEEKLIRKALEALPND